MRYILPILLFSSLVIAAEKPRTFSAELQQGGNKVGWALGRYGGWLVPTQERWDELRARMKPLGLKIQDDLGKIDFDKEDIACVFHYGGGEDQFSLYRVDGDEKSREVKFAMSYVILNSRRALELGVWKILAVPVAKARQTVVTVSTYHPKDNGPHATADNARLEWRWTFGPDTGEAVAGLTANIAVRDAVIKPGDDILLKARLLADGAAEPGLGQFARRSEETVRVWDNKYSNGYRNDAYEVVTPDGRTLLLRRPEQLEWRKNIPHPVNITADKPYELVNWAGGENLKSLKTLGLKTEKPGKYRVTLIYQEMGEPIQDNHGEMWGGVVRSNTIAVDVK